jgi:hypothetical protein
MEKEAAEEREELLKKEAFRHEHERMRKFLALQIEEKANYHNTEKQNKADYINNRLQLEEEQRIMEKKNK